MPYLWSLTILFCLSLPLRGWAEEVTTLDGKTYSGKVQLDGSQIVVHGKIDVRLDPAKVRQAAFTPPTNLTGAWPIHGLQVEFFNDINLAMPLYQRLDPNIDFAWPLGVPAPGVPPQFSVRWTGFVTAPSTASYNMSLDHDDGARLWIGGKLVIDEWHNSVGIHRVQVSLEAGKPTPIRLEVFNGPGGGCAHLSWAAPNQADQMISTDCFTPPPDYDAAKSLVSADDGKHGWLGLYSADPDMALPLFSRIEPAIWFDWHQTRPSPQFHERFGACWIAHLTPPTTDRYTFKMASHDGMRVTIGGKTIIDQWQPRPPETAATVELQGGKTVTIVVNYFDLMGDPYAVLRWSSPRFNEQPIPWAYLTPGTTDERRALIKGVGLRGEFFEDDSFKKRLAVRRDAQLDCNWVPNSQDWPAPGLPEAFTARWTGKLIVPKDGDYTLSIKPDDRARIYLDGKLVVNAWDTILAEASATVPLRASHHYDIKVEFANINGPASIHMWWAGPGLPKQIIPAAQFIPPDPEITIAPQVALTFASQQIYALDDTLHLHADTSVDGGDHVTRVAFYDGDQLIGTRDAPPYDINWKISSPGRRVLSARVWDVPGYVGTSQLKPIDVVQTAGDVVSDGWFHYRIGEGAGEQTNDRIGGADGRTTVTVAAGDAWGTADRLHYIFRPLDGDGVLTVHVDSLAGDPPDNLPAAGIMVRASLNPDSPSASMLMAKCPEVQGFYLARGSAGAEMTPNGLQLGTGRWLKLERAGTTLALSVSPDGQQWTAAGKFDIDLPRSAFIGVAVACSRNGTASAAFDHLQFTPAPPAAATAASGVQMIDGTLLAGQLISAGNDVVTMRWQGKDLRLKSAEVARLLFHPVSADVSAALRPGASGVVLTGGDFAEGTFSEFADGMVTISSVLFGPQTFSAVTDAAAVVLHDTAKPVGFAVTAADGSIYPTADLQVKDGRIQLESAVVGKLTLSSADVLIIHQGP